MNFKKYHVSRNLFDKDNTTIYNAYFAENGSWNPSTDSRSILIPVSPNTEYTLSISRSSPIFRIYETILENPQPYSQFQVIVRTTDISSYTFTTGSNTKYIGFQGSGVLVDDWFNSLMLNTGSTALPYEPYSSEVWHDTPHYIYNTSTDTITPPTTIYADGTNATIGLKGNMSQTGTPTPENPVMPQECGERTGNLCQLYKTGYYIDNSGTERENVNFTIYSAKIPSSGDYTLSYTYSSGGSTTVRIHSYSGGSWQQKLVETDLSSTPITITATSGIDEIRISINNAAQNVMLNTGSTALPYEPYSYKIPISSANTTTPVYLGEVETTRKIKKYEFTGEENWIRESGNTYALEGIEQVAIGYANALCTHYVLATSYSTLTGTDGTFSVSRRPALFIHDENFTSVAQLKAYLATQYANGTPVTVWYVLATPTIGIVNEPLRKIGDYADEVSGITIPTIAGANTLSVGTTLQPSEVTATYRGWHEGTVHERDSGAWD